MKPIFIIIAFLSVWSALSVRAFSFEPSLEENFIHPPDSARPWVYWFWNNGNVTKEGITADLEAMKRVGIGGVLIMDVVERFPPPQGTATFMGSEWRTLFQFALSETHRLGLKVNMTNGPGWCGSSGPWITPELSMQTLVDTDTVADGPRNFDGVLARPKLKTVVRKDVLTNHLIEPDFYRDIAVLAFPEPINNMIQRGQIVNLTSMMDKNGRLLWKIPPGKWHILRIGHTSTGSSTRPPVVGGNGLECDKLSKDAMDVHFAGMMKRLVDRAGPLAGQTLVATHIDSWEVGKQNWTPRFREEFQKRRGYDPVPLLPDVISNLQIGGKTLADRFRWDFDETVAELLAENYSGHIAELAHKSGLRFTLEGYELPFGDEATYSAAADEPMTEFWTPGRYGAKITQLKAHQMASVSHLYGRTVTGAESFTSDDKEEWKLYPATIKALGDYEFCQGVNRFVFHRYAHQPYLGRFPGVTMGPWGLHYERTNTWWEMSGPWHDYVARCSYVLRQGNFVADILYARPEMPNQTYFSPNPAPPPGYNYDEASARAIMDRATVEHGRIVLPDGMSYRLLVLSPASTMTPQFLGKIRDLVAAGACVLGPPPHSSPSLQDYPHCDDEVANTVKQVWGSCDGKAATEHAFGTGTVFNGLPLADLLQKLHTPPDFYSDTKLNWIHRCVGDKDIYFVANPTPEEVTAHCTFRVTGLHAEAWNPEDGTLSELQPTNQGPTDTAIDLRLDPTGSLFVVFRPTDADATYLSKPPVKTKVSGSISGPWHLQFSPGWGAPEKVTTENLFSWSDSPVEGIKYYSGTATYTGTFSIKSEWLNPAQREFLDLGEVEVIARVRINGKDKGILWKPPYKVEITGDLTAGDNTLDISVANHCGICAVPEFANVLTRARIKFHQIIGHLDSPACWKEIGDWISAAQVVKGIEHNRLGVMGHYYSGMLDIYTDLTLQSVVFGTHIEILEVDELTALRREVTEEEASLQVKAFHMEFDIRQDCSQQELMRAARTAVALGRLIKQKGLGSLAYYYKGTGVPENQDTITSIILGNSLLTARGCPVAGELEIKNVQAMKILDLLGVGGSFTEYYAVDWKDDVVLMGHDGPGHIGIAQEKPRVRPLEVYHGKVGEGLSIEMSVRHGPVTLLSVVETANGCIKLLCAEGECIPGPLLEIGNTNSRFRFAMGASQFIQRWNAEGPAHHCAVGTGHLANIISKIASLLEVEIVTLTI